MDILCQTASKTPAVRPTTTTTTLAIGAAAPTRYAPTHVTAAQISAEIHASERGAGPMASSLVSANLDSSLASDNTPVPAWVDDLRKHTEESVAYMSALIQGRQI